MSGRVCVTALSAYPESAASARVRVVGMARYLAPLGVNVAYRPSVSVAEYAAIGASAPWARQVAPLARGVVRATADALRSRDGLVLVHKVRSLLPVPLENRLPIDVYDFDDAVFLRSSAAGRSPVSRLKREPARAISAMRHARLVLAGNAYLADAASSIAKRVEIVPSCVDPDAYLVREHREVSRLVLAWVGSPSTGFYLRPLFESLAPFGESGQIRLVVMGARPERAPGWVEHCAWSLAAERRLLGEADIGVMPLPADPWTRGKCGYKILTYYAAGLPTIASPVGVNELLLENGRGISAVSPAQWRNGIEILSDSRARAEMGRAAREYVQRAYSYAVWAPRLANLLSEL